MPALANSKLPGMHQDEPFEGGDMFRPADDLFGSYSQQQPKHEPLFGDARVEPLFGDARVPAPLFDEPVGDLFGPSSNDIFADSPSSRLPKQPSEDPSKVFGSIQKSPAPVGEIVAKNARYTSDSPSGSKKQDDLFDGGDDGLFGGGDFVQVKAKPVNSLVRTTLLLL